MSLEGFKFTKDHEWVKSEADITTIGITDYAQKELGDIVYVELPSPGDKIKKGEACSNIESVKAVNDIYTPVTGEITEVNEALEDTPELINQDPYGSGWIFKIKLESHEELDDLMDQEAYNQYLKGISKE
ncbi:MAG: glycine cleavage system protein GcvH [Candidatus Aminicenantes bacterium]|nr:glycine cleavage system protein GcvH [Candidatus Aminicenantes bacterium]